MPSLAGSYSIADLRELARRRLPAPMFHYIDGGADDEWSLRRNTDAFDEYQLIPDYLRDVGEIDLRATVLGQSLALPFFLSPTGMSRLFHHGKELAVSRAAAEAGTLYTLSTLATTSLEDVAAMSSGPKMFQIYILKDRELTREFVQRCKAAGFQAMCLTVDTMVAGNRERELRFGMTMPPRIGWKNALSYASSFHWLFHMALSPDFRLANVVHRVDALGRGAMGLIDYINSQFDRSVGWEDVRWLVEQWGGPFLVKGILSVEGALRARDVGATGVMISNHGGRQLEATPAPVDCIAELRDALGQGFELICDGGIRRGTHIVKALALGADACSIGRPYLYGLAAGGRRGVARALGLLRAELERSMALLGCSSVAELRPEHVRRMVG